MQESFSFNNPFGACPECFGLGYKMEFDEDLMIPDKSLSIDQGAIVVMGWQSCADKGSFTRAILEALSEAYDFRLDTPFQDYPKEIHDVLLYGTGGREVKVRYKSQRGEGVYDVAFEGLIENVNRRYKETFSEASKAEYETYMRITPCPVCKGQRLKKESLAVTVGGMNIYEATNMSIVRFKEFMDGLKLTPMQETIGASILKEIRARICFLIDVGLDYLSLSRATGTLSGGEAQRIRLATQIGSGLVGVAYILDEPSIGLHQRDNDKLLKTLTHLRDLGNSVLVVEHDEDTMRAADCIVDIGPGAGEHGGKVIAMGTAEEIMKNPDSITGAYLSGRVKIPVPAERRKPTGWITVKGAAENNLKNINVDIPLGIMTCVTGVSGSGKSSLVNEIVYKSLARKLNRARTIPGRHKSIEGVEQLDKIREVAFGGGTKLSAEDGFLQFMIERLLAGSAPEPELAEEDQEENGDDMKLTSIQSLTDFMNCAGRTLPDNIRIWARRNLAVARSHEVTPEERRHAQRALSIMMNIQWKNHYFESIDPVEARRILDEELYGMERVKQRIIETIIQINRTHTLPAYGMLLVGPAGTGKSQIAYAVARILKLPWTTLVMSSINDSEQLTGSSRIYSNAKPGIIMEAFSMAGESNLVFIINELDKASSGKGNGNPADVLLTLLDNLGFTDNYIECMIPTGGVYPIATANDKSQISAPLMSRFAVIDIPDYTPEEKKIIFSKYAMPKVLKRMGLHENECVVTEDALDAVIEKYADTTGIRDLEQAAEHMAANALYQIEVDNVAAVVFDGDMVRELLG